MKLLQVPEYASAVWVSWVKIKLRISKMYSFEHMWGFYAVSKKFSWREIFHPKKWRIRYTRTLFSSTEVMYALDKLTLHAT